MAARSSGVSRSGSGIKAHPVVSREEWLAARTALLAKEKELTHHRDEVSRERRALPWVKVEKEYVFDGPNGQRKSLADLFEKRSQLVVYHFMFSPEWDEGCKSCSFWADHYDAPGIHLNHRDVSFAAISRAPIAKIEKFKKRMGWRFRWLSSADSDFNFDFGVSFTPEQVKSGKAVYNYTHTPGMTDREGLSVFYKNGRSVYHTYSAFERGIEPINGTYDFLDLVPKGRDEDPDNPHSWVRFHDRYIT